MSSERQSGHRVQTVGMGSESIMTTPISYVRIRHLGSLPSVNTSDHAWPMYILLVSMQASGVAPRPIQLVEIGRHWNKLAVGDPVVSIFGLRWTWSDERSLSRRVPRICFVASETRKQEPRNTYQRRMLLSSRWSQ